LLRFVNKQSCTVSTEKALKCTSSRAKFENFSGRGTSLPQSSLKWRGIRQLSNVCPPKISAAQTYNPSYVLVFYQGMNVQFISG